jgi:hypothetical protein
MGRRDVVGRGGGPTRARRRQAAVSVALLLGLEIGVVRGSCLEDVGRWL